MVWKYFRNIVKKGLKKSNFHSFVQFHSVEMLSLVWKYSRNTLEKYRKYNFHAVEEVQFLQGMEKRKAFKYRLTVIYNTVYKVHCNF